MNCFFQVRNAICFVCFFERRYRARFGVVAFFQVCFVTIFKPVYILLYSVDAFLMLDSDTLVSQFFPL